MILHRMNAPNEQMLQRLMEEARREASRHGHNREIDDDALRRPAVVIIDMDGTLVRHRRPTILRLLEIFGSIEGGFSRLARPSRQTDMDGGYERPPRLLGHRLLHGLRRSDVRKIVAPATGVAAFLEALHKADIPVALVSNGLGRGYGQDILLAFDLERHFAATLFRENIRRPKPAPDSLIAARQALGERGRGQVWYIGDQAKDMTAARAAQKESGGNWKALLYCPSASPPYAAACYADFQFRDWDALTTRLATLRAHAALPCHRGQILDDRT
jgi:phosphoglycolate phosphatase